MFSSDTWSILKLAFNSFLYSFLSPKYWGDCIAKLCIVWNWKKWTSEGALIKAAHICWLESHPNQLPVHNPHYVCWCIPLSAIAGAVDLGLCYMDSSANIECRCVSKCHIPKRDNPFLGSGLLTSRKTDWKKKGRYFQT